MEGGGSGKKQVETRKGGVEINKKMGIGDKILF